MRSPGYYDNLGKPVEASKAAVTAVKTLDGKKEALRDLAWYLADARHPRELADVALAAVAAAGEPTPGLLVTKTRILARGKGDFAGAGEAARRVVDSCKNNLVGLNDFAWTLLTEDEYQRKLNDVALLAAQAMRECEDWDVEPYILDTIALAMFENGRVDEAIKLQQLALDKGGAKADPRLGYQERMDRYLKAKQTKSRMDPPGTTSAESKPGER